MTNISTMTSHNKMMRAVTDTYTAVNKITNKIATEKNYENFHEIDPNKLRLSEDLSNEVEMTKNRINNNKLLLRKFNEYEGKIETIQNVTQEAMRFIQIAKNPINKNTLAIGNTATGYINEIKRLLSSTFNGDHLFSGSKTNVAPIGPIDSISNIMPDGTISSNYYHGDSVIASQNVSSTHNISYGITADDPTFQKLFAAFHYAIKFEASGDKTHLTKSFDLLDEAKNDLSEMVATLGSNADTVERIVKNDELAIVEKNEIISSILNIQPDLEYTELAPKIAKLQATFMVVSKASTMFIGDYIR